MSRMSLAVLLALAACQPRLITDPDRRDVPVSQDSERNDERIQGRQLGAQEGEPVRDPSEVDDSFESTDSTADPGVPAEPPENDTDEPTDTDVPTDTDEPDDTGTI